MPRTNEDKSEQHRVHIWLYTSDWEELKSLYGDSIGPSKFVRLVVRQALKRVREKTNVQRPHQSASTPSIDEDLGDLTSADG